MPGRTVTAGNASQQNDASAARPIVAEHKLNANDSGISLGHPTGATGVRVRAELLVAPAGTTVREVATGWGWVNFGLFAAAHRRRFDETPSTTLRRR